jgi:3-phenylpropionate/trans-cinnamate dioxygenase ferredoxin reductase component
LDGRLAVVESINKPADHMAARRLIGEGIPLSPAEAADASFDLRGRAQGR